MSEYTAEQLINMAINVRDCAWPVDVKEYMELIEPMLRAYAATLRQKGTTVEDDMRLVAERIAASTPPEDEARLGIAYAIARYLNLDGWPCAKEKPKRQQAGFAGHSELIERFRHLCAAMYQAAGAYDMPERFLDALSDAASGEIEKRRKTDALLPCDMPLHLQDARMDEDARCVHGCRCGCCRACKNGICEQVKYTACDCIAALSQNTQAMDVPTELDEVSLQLVEAIEERDHLRKVLAQNTQAGQGDAVPMGIDGCTESNCPRCKTHPDHRGDMKHAGIGSYPDTDRTLWCGFQIVEDKSVPEHMILVADSRGVAAITAKPGDALYTYPAERAAVLDGWKLVPREPTPEMFDACNTIIQSYGAKLVYQRMLDAAPKPAQEGSE